MKPDKYDFSGYVTRFNVKCADGRTIRHGAFEAQDGAVLPMVYSHVHDQLDRVIGNVTLENRDDGVYGFASCNHTAMGEYAKECVMHGDLKYFSIFADRLKETPQKDVMHGTIREVSLVLAGANPGAYIDVPLAHSADQNEEFEATIYNPDDCEIELYHSELPKEEKEETPKEESKVADNKERTVKDVYDEMTDEQKKVVQFMIGMALQDKEGEAHYDDGGNKEMKHNLFDNEEPNEKILSPEELKAFFKDAKRYGTLKHAVEEGLKEGGVLCHALFNSDGTEQTYGVTDIDMLFPDAKELNNPPQMIRRHTEWVDVVLKGVHRVPYSRIRTTYANITMDEARAKGYLKGNRKKEEVFSLLRRSITPQTIYKKQKADRDDIIDIVDFAYVGWIKGEMRLMLDEEIARAILIGDGRLVTDEDHIMWDHITPVIYDDDLFNIKAHVTAGVDDQATTKNMITTFIRAMENYEGSGNMTLFMPQKWITEALLLEDGFGRPLYSGLTDLANKMQVDKIVKCPLMKNFTYGTNQTLMGVALDLHDYAVGADKGGAINMFEDFDIDYNQEKYLIETRCSGMPTVPFSAITLILGGSDATYTAATVTAASTPKASGWYVKEGDLYVKAKDVTPVVVGKDSEDHDVYRTYYVKS